MSEMILRASRLLCDGSTGRNRVDCRHPDPRIAMNRISATLLLVAVGSIGTAADVAPPPRTKVDPAVALAAAIDAHLARAWAVKGVVPAAPADDAEFLRRVSLD